MLLMRLLHLANGSIHTLISIGISHVVPSKKACARSSANPDVSRPAEEASGLARWGMRRACVPVTDGRCCDPAEWPAAGLAEGPSWPAGPEEPVRWAAIVRGQPDRHGRRPYPSVGGPVKPPARTDA